MIDRTALATGRLNTGSEVTVAFADLVGFTRLGEELPPERLGGVVDRLGELAAEVAQRPVQLVKMIGDAAMLVSPEPAALLDATLTLVQRSEEQGDDFPALRAGVASGTALTRGGDWYGRPVNLASRITNIARPGSVLTSREVRDAVGEDGYRWSFAGDRKLKGVRGDTRVYRVRPGEKRAQRGRELPAKTKNQIPKQTPASATETTITTLSIRNGRPDSRSPRMLFIHGTCTRTSRSVRVTLW